MTFAVSLEFPYSGHMVAKTGLPSLEEARKFAAEIGTSYANKDGPKASGFTFNVCVWQLIESSQAGGLDSKEPAVKQSSSEKP